LEVKHVDLVCINEKNEKWVIEAKGNSTSVGIDFNTGLGQILKRMDDPDCQYALAVPNIPKYINQLNKVPKRVQNLLGLCWIRVSGDGTITIDFPLGDNLEFNRREVQTF
jgi:hypothetical protein